MPNTTFDDDRCYECFIRVVYVLVQRVRRVCSKEKRLTSGQTYKVSEAKNSNMHIMFCCVGSGTLLIVLHRIQPPEFTSPSAGWAVYNVAKPVHLSKGFCAQHVHEL